MSLRILERYLDRKKRRDAAEFHADYVLAEAVHFTTQMWKEALPTLDLARQRYEGRIEMTDAATRKDPA